MTLVSVCIPAYQAAWSLGTTLRSVLAQTHSPLEVVVVDNASTDGTAQVLAQFDDPRLRVVTQPSTLPIAANWRAAVAASRGEHVKLLCSDDVLHPGAIAAQSAVLDAHPEVALVAGRRRVIDSGGRVVVARCGLGAWEGRVPAAEVIRRYVGDGTNVIGEPVGTLFRRADYDAVGGFAETGSYVLDMDLWARLLSRGDLWAERSLRGDFRLSQGSVTAKGAGRHLAENRRFVSRLAADPRWGVGPALRAYGFINVPRVFYQWRLQSSLLTRQTPLNLERCSDDPRMTARHAS